jgi:hypothetical protein
MKPPAFAIAPFALLLAAMAPATALSQEPMFMGAATHPGAGQAFARLRLYRSEHESARADAIRQSAHAELSYGIRPTLAAVADAEFARISGDGPRSSGLAAASLQAKLRIYKRDFGPLDTWRTSLLGGLVFPGDLDERDPDDPYPRAALVSTAILGRHGLNAQANWEGPDGTPDRFAANASHLYRLSPAQYAPSTLGAWYSMLESLNDFTDDGNSRSDLALGLLYEARRWAAEASLRLPLSQDGPQTSDYVLAFGIRWLP